MWLGGMTTEEGARRQPSGKPDIYRGEPRYPDVHDDLPDDAAVADRPRVLAALRYPRAAPLAAGRLRANPPGDGRRELREREVRT